LTADPKVKTNAERNTSQVTPAKRKRRAKGDGSDDKPTKGVAQFPDEWKDKAVLAASLFCGLVASKDAYGDDEVTSDLVARAWRRAWHSTAGDNAKVPALTVKMNGYVQPPCFVQRDRMLTNV
jgi:hypothetical protein